MISTIHTWKITAMIAILAPTLAFAQLSGIAKVSAGRSHTCTVSTNGDLLCWGLNDLGALGDNTSVTRPTPTAMFGISENVVSVAAGYDHTCFVTSLGAVNCTGNNAAGQLGNNSNTTSWTPVAVDQLSSGVSDVAAGRYHSCALTTNGGVMCWGSNSGKLGDGTATNRLTPVSVVGMSSGVTSLSIGHTFSCAVTSSASVKCWGGNSYGELGDGSNSTRTSPVDVVGLSSGWLSVSAGFYHACSVNSAGAVKCWGRNLFGALGNGTTTNSNVPVDIVALSSGVMKVAAGAWHTCALTTSGGVRCWGDNATGQLADGTTLDRLTPVTSSSLSLQYSDIRLGERHGCAISTSNTIQCWGSNTKGQLGNGATALRYAAVTVAGLSSGASAIATSNSYGGQHTCALSSAGAVRCWGTNTNGSLGRTTPRWSVLPLEVDGLSSGIVSLAVGSSFSGGAHSCAVKSTGELLCWGYNGWGQIGDGTSVSKFIPTASSGLNAGVSSVSAGFDFTCLVTTAGGAKCMGDNSYGKLGDGTNTSRASATSCIGLSSGIAQISTGNGHACVVTTMGAVKCWGSNFNGEIGDGGTTTQLSAVAVSGLSAGVSNVSAGRGHTCALTTGGGVKCWGANFFGALGDGSTIDSLVPVDVVGLTSGVLQVSSGSTHTCAVMLDGTVKCWGDNYSGQLGDGTLSPRSVPVDAHGVNSAISISAGAFQTCIQTSLGSLACWGDNSDGQLGEDLAISSVLQTRAASGSATLSGTPLAGVMVRATGIESLYGAMSYQTSGSGTWQLSLVETTPYTITPELAGYTFSPPSITGTMSADISQDFVATLITYGISGNVTANGNPLVGAAVDAGGIGITTTDGSGNYSFSGILPATSYTLTVSHPGATFGTSTASGTLNADSTHNFSGTLTTHSISGTILVGGSPLVGVAVSGGGLGSDVTDAGGVYSFTGVTYGTSYAISPSLTDYEFSPTQSSGTVSSDVTHDFTGIYNPPTTVATTSIGTTVPSTVTSTVATTTVELTTTISGTSTAAPNSSTTPGISTTVNITTTVGPTTSTVNTTPVTTTVPPDSIDTDNDGITDGEELSSGTNPKDPGSKAPKLRSTICSDWNGYLGGTTGRGMYNIMEHINLTNKKLRVKTELRSIRGHLKDTYEFFLRGSQQFDLLVHDMSGMEPNSYGQVCTTYERAPAGSLDGRMVYYKYGNTAEGANGIQFAFALPFENPATGTTALLYNTVQPSLNHADVGNLVANWVQLSNVSKNRLKGRLYFHRPDGTQLTKPVDVNLRDGARYDYSAHGYGANLTGLIRFVPRDKTVEYQLREVRYLYDNAGTQDSFASAYPFGAEVGSGETMIAPVDTTDSGAVLELGNMLATKVTANIKLYDSAGKTLLYSKAHSLKAYGSEHVLLDTHLVAGRGVVVVKASATKTSATKTAMSTAGSLLGQVVHYSRKATGSVQNMYAMPLREPIGTSMRGSYNTYLNQGCTLYLANAASVKEKVTVSLKQGDGTSPAQDYQLSLPARGILAEDICSKSPPNVYGVVTVTATKPKRIYGAVVRNGEGGRYRMGTELR